MARKKRERGKRRENRHERRQKQHSGGGEWSAIRIPDGVEIFKPEDGKTYRLDIIPYVVGEGNPAADPGDEYFEMSYWVYKNLGPDEKTVVAIGKMKGVPDPVEELEADMRKRGMDYDSRADFIAKARQLFLVYDHGDADKGVQLFEGARGTFGEQLDEAIGAADEDEHHIIDFDDPEAGSTLKVTFKGKNIGQANPWVRCTNISFKARPNGLEDESLLDHGIVLEDLIKYLSYDELKALLEGTATREPEEEEEEQEPPKRNRRPKKPKPEPEPEPEDDEMTADEAGIGKGDTVDHPDHGECTVVRVSKDGTTLVLMDDDDNVYKGVAVADVAGEEDPPPKKGKGGSRSAKDAPSKNATKTKPAASRSKKPKPEPEPEPEEPDDDEDWDEDWDEDE